MRIPEVLKPLCREATDVCVLGAQFQTQAQWNRAGPLCAGEDRYRSAFSIHYSFPVAALGCEGAKETTVSYWTIQMPEIVRQSGDGRRAFAVHSFESDTETDVSFSKRQSFLDRVLAGPSPLSRSNSRNDVFIYTARSKFMYCILYCRYKHVCDANYGMLPRLLSQHSTTFIRPPCIFWNFHIQRHRHSFLQKSLLLLSLCLLP